MLLEEFLRSIGFISLPLDLSVFNNDKIIISKVALAVYVDYLLIAGRNKKGIFYNQQFLKQRFEAKVLDELRMVLDIRLKKFGQCMTLDQS